MSRLAALLLLAGCVPLSGWRGRLVRADRSLRDGRYQEAERDYKEAVRLAEKGGPAALAHALAGLGAFRELQGEPDEAESLYRRALSAGAGLGADSPSSLALMDRLADLSAARGGFEESEAMLRRALKATPPDSPDRERRLAKLGMFLQSRGRTQEAEESLRKALDASAKSHGRRHPETAERLSDLAQLLQGLRRFEEAETLHRAALEIRLEAYGPQHPLAFQSLHRLALFYQAQGKLAEALTHYRRAAAAAERAAPGEGAELARILEDFAALLRRMGQKEEAERAAAKAASLRLR